MLTKLWPLSRFFFCSGPRPGPHLALVVTSSPVTSTWVWHFLSLFLCLMTLTPSVCTGQAFCWMSLDLSLSGYFSQLDQGCRLGGGVPQRWGAFLITSHRVILIYLIAVMVNLITWSECLSWFSTVNLVFSLPHSTHWKLILKFSPHSKAETHNLWIYHCNPLYFHFFLLKSLIKWNSFWY